MKLFFDCMIKYFYYVNWIVYKLLKKKVVIKRVIYLFYGSRYIGSYIFGIMGFYILNFVKILICIFFEKGKREKERERGGGVGEGRREN